MKKWKAADMVFVQLWNNDYVGEKNHTQRTLIYQTPAYESVGDESYEIDNGKTERIQLTVNVEEGLVFLEGNEKAKKIFENEQEIELFVRRVQTEFDNEIDMGKGNYFVFGYGGKMATFREYDNPNIEYIPLVFPDDEKFSNPRYKEKVQESLISKGAIFIKGEGKEAYLAVIQRKNKPRDLKPFARFLAVKDTEKKPTSKQDIELVKIQFPSWLGEKLGIQTTKKEIRLETVIKSQTDKAVLVSYNGKSTWLPKAKIKIV